MQPLTFNVRIATSSKSAVAEALQQCGQPCPPVAGLPHASSFKLTSVPTIDAVNTLSLAGVQFMAALTSLHPEPYRLLTQQLHPGEALLPQAPDDDFIPRLAAQTSDVFAAFIASAGNALLVPPAPLRLSLTPTPEETYISRTDREDYFLTVSLDLSKTDYFLKDKVLGIDWGQRKLLTIAASDDMASVQPFTVPEELHDWTRNVPLDHRETEWLVMQALIARALQPALDFVIERGATVRTEDLQFRGMNKDTLERLRRLGMLDLQKAILPQLVYASGGRSERVRPHYSSCTCPLCGEPARRYGQTLTCRHHGDFDADAAAALLIRRGGVHRY